MHEMALAEGILEVVLDVAQDRPVKRVHLHVGALHAVVPESLQFSFQVAAQDTPADEAMLSIDQVHAVFQCNHCGEVTDIATPPYNCRSCGSADVTISAGDELIVESVELEDGTKIKQAVSADPGLVEGHLKGHLVGNRTCQQQKGIDQYD
jgi:hydrogenase nickel incorporation protein HypA/HybF